MSPVTQLQKSLLVWCLLCTTLTADQWPQFRGPDGMGHSAAVGVPTEWSESHNVAWKTPIEGTGWSSPVIWDNQIWITTATDEKVLGDELKAAGEEKPFPVAVARNLKMFAVCVDKESGEIIYNVEVLAEESRPQFIR